MSAITTFIEGERTVCRGVFGERAQELDCVVSRYLPMFYKRALRFLGNAPDAEDAVQDALLSAYRHLGQFRGQAKLSTWLMAIVTNAARMQLRRRQSGYFSLDQEQGEEGLTFSERLADSKPSPEEACSTVEARNRLVEGVQRLSPKLRRTFHLCDIDSLTTKEAALVLGVPQGTVKAQLARARAKLAGIVRGKPVRQRSRTLSVGKAVSTKGAPSENSIWPKPAPNANAIRFLDENLATVPASGIPEVFRKLSRFFPVIVIVPKPDVEDEATQKKLEPNKSVTDLTDTRSVCLPLDAAKAGLTNSNATDTFEFGGVRGCLSTMEIRRNGRPVTLTSKEVKLLAFLIRNPRRVISRDELLNEVWGYENYPSTRTVDNHILKLRKKLEPEPADPKHFDSVHCAGYRFLP